MKWGAAFGLYGEQGMEKLHKTINNLKRSFNSMPNKQERIQSIMKEHYMRVNPKQKQKHLFEIKTRKRKAEE